MFTSDYLQALRSKLGLTEPSEIARLIGASPHSVRLYEKGSVQFRDEVAVRVAKLLDVNPSIVLLDMYIARTSSEEARLALTQTRANLFDAELLTKDCWKADSPKTSELF
ncbi:helix-turn-helix transcriptional regulator [Noviherbaspirillum sp. CPCC 100848]|jgi:transcriptional regulator with XRE-family HTH domain|uniref:Helix-turn-helix transcriptional regulator n=1 Tax=Noviherbaspirillum album TaxID=3080276 RepID=A0ABU6J4M6_9BURK|nr:helix-turn-helix transcriptional regulator [Noviherbaspirillum sp. CPCC 100848]MEC4718386.1 helix-turn-helix transcriptional regulator [Noviherbaspirillum sp. CPCC 100848]